MGGCDGSINFGNSDNASLTGPANNIANAYARALDTRRSGATTATLFKKLSRADFFSADRDESFGFGNEKWMLFP